MPLVLTVLLCLLSAGIMAGRIYEILNLTDPQTGFLLVKGIVFNPFILAIFAVITICCGILIFGDIKKAKPYFSSSSGFSAVLAGIALVAAGAAGMSTDKVSAFIVAGGLGLILMGVAGLGKRKTDFAVIALFTIFTAGMCVDVVSFDVYTMSNVAFAQNALAYLSIAVFLLMVLKNVYIPSKYSRMFLYIAWVLAFVMCGIMSFADIVCFAIQGGSFTADFVKDIGFALFGVFAFDTAVSSMPAKRREKAEAEPVLQKENRQPQQEEIQPEPQQEFSAQDNQPVQQPVNAQPAQTEEQRDILRIMFGDDEDNAAQLTALGKNAAEKEEQPAQPQYDMLKSMFKGEDTDDKVYPAVTAVNTDKEQPQTQPQNAEKVRFTADGTKAAKDKTTAKKIVYKKPK